VAQLGEWVVVVDVPQDLRNEVAESLSRLMGQELTEWAAATEQRLSVEYQLPIRISTEG